MVEYSVSFLQEDYNLLASGMMEAIDFLNKILPIDAKEIINPENRLVNLLRSYHPDDGGAVTVTQIVIAGVTYDATERVGKIIFKYCLAYHYACSYDEKEYEKTEKINFLIDTNESVVVLSFLETDTRSTADEF